MRLKFRKVIFLFLFLWFSSFSYFSIVQPAIMSYKFDCSISTLEEMGNVAVVGSFDVETSEIQIFQEVNTEQYNRTLKHELKHLQQKNEGRLYLCSYPTGVILNEMEAYLAEYF